MLSGGALGGDHVLRLCAHLLMDSGLNGPLSDAGPDWSSELVEGRPSKGVSCPWPLPLSDPLLPGCHEVSSLITHIFPLSSMTLRLTTDPVPWSQPAVTDTSKTVSQNESFFL